MIRRWLPAAALALAWMATPSLVAQAQLEKPAAPTPSAPAVKAERTERPVPFRAGETLTFDISWSQYLTAGTATVTVREKRPSFSSTAYYIVAEGRPTPLLSKLYTLYYKADTLLDVFTLLPQRGSVYSEEGSRSRMKATLFDQTARRGSYEVKTATVFKKDLVLPAFTQDPLSAIYVIRALPLKLGGTLTMPVADDGIVYRVRVRVVAQEAIATPLGRLTAWKIVPTILDAKGKPTGEKFGLWISDDARKLPLKMEAELGVGRFVIVLKDVRG
jgi:hypothetical protein